MEGERLIDEVSATMSVSTVEGEEEELEHARRAGSLYTYLSFQASPTASYTVQAK